MRTKHYITPIHLALLLVIGLLPIDARTVRFSEREEPLPNPLKGWVIWGEDHITPPQPVTLFFSYRSWRQLEPEEGQYDFESWEREVWQYWVERGMKVIFRVYLDYPGRPVGVPQWLVDQGVELSEYDEYGGGWSPDYENPLLLEKVKDLIVALGERYDDDPRVGFLDVGILGHWGEWHTYPREELFASASVQREVMNTFLAVFSNKKMMLRYPTVWTAKQRFGYRDDCFLTDTEGPEDWYFFSRIRSANAEEVWKTQPFGGEFCGGGAGAIEGTVEQPDECLRLIREGHFSHLGPAGGSIEAQDDAHQQTIDSMLKLMGYRFVIREADLPETALGGNTLQIKFTVENTGVAPFYYPWPLEIVWFDGEAEREDVQTTDIDIRTWLPGTHEVSLSVSAPSPSKETQYNVAIEIPDPGGGGPPVRFANVGEEQEGAFILGSVKIQPASSCTRWQPY
ncbi:MAG: hypothetical protein DRI92_03650 [Aquificota bacterium]|nr:MAG: hypothetical protein DRI92_03650 [Aquificota bacterium]